MNNLIIKKTTILEFYTMEQQSEKNTGQWFNQPNLFFVNYLEKCLKFRQVPLAAYYNETSRKTTKEKTGKNGMHKSGDSVMKQNKVKDFIFLKNHCKADLRDVVWILWN